MKLNTWILALLLLGSLFLLYTYVTRPLPDALAQGQRLLRTDTVSVHTLSITDKKNQYFSFTRAQNAWLVTDGANSRWVTDAQMSPLLQALSKMNALDMRPSARRDAPTIRVVLSDNQGNALDAFRLIQTHPDSIWLGYPDVPEVYRIESAIARPFFEPLEYYLPPYFLRWDLPDSLAYGPDSSLLVFHLSDTTWLLPPVASSDSVRIRNWLDSLPLMTIDVPLRDMQQAFDSTQIIHKIQVWDGGQLVRIHGLSTADKRGAWSSQRAEKWLENVDSLWYRQLFPVWMDSLVQNEL